MGRLVSFLFITGLVVILSGCTVSMQLDYLHPTPAPSIGTPHSAPQAESPQSTVQGSEAITPTATTVPTATPRLHFVSIRPEDGFPITSTLKATSTLALSTYLIQTDPIQEDRYSTASFRSLSDDLSRVGLVLARPVTDTNQVPPMKPSLAADRIVLQRSSAVQEPECGPAQDLRWYELRVIQPADGSGVAMPLPLEWSWPISTLCAIPAGADWNEIIEANKLWCRDASCAGQKLWVDVALVEASSDATSGWTLYRFAKDLGPPSVPGGTDEQTIFCKSIGCLDGGTICLYCWLNGCGC